MLLGPPPLVQETSSGTTSLPTKNNKSGACCNRLFHAVYNPNKRTRQFGFRIDRFRTKETEYQNSSASRREKTTAAIVNRWSLFFFDAPPVDNNIRMFV